MDNEFVLTKYPSRHQQLEVPEASVGRIWEEQLSYNKWVTGRLEFDGVFVISISSRGCVGIDQISWFFDTSCQFFYLVAIVQKLYSTSIMDENSDHLQCLLSGAIRSQAALWLWWNKLPATARPHHDLGVIYESLGWGWMTGGHEITSPTKHFYKGKSLKFTYRTLDLHCLIH